MYITHQPLSQLYRLCSKMGNQLALIDHQVSKCFDLLEVCASGAFRFESTCGCMCDHADTYMGLHRSPVHEGSNILR